MLHCVCHLVNLMLAVFNVVSSGQLRKQQILYFYMCLWSWHNGNNQYLHESITQVLYMYFYTFFFRSLQNVRKNLKWSIVAYPFVQGRPRSMCVCVCVADSDIKWWWDVCIMGCWEWAAAAEFPWSLSWCSFIGPRTLWNRKHLCIRGQILKTPSTNILIGFTHTSQPPLTWHMWLLSLQLN